MMRRLAGGSAAGAFGPAGPMPALLSPAWWTTNRSASPGSAPAAGFCLASRRPACKGAATGLNDWLGADWLHPAAKRQQAMNSKSDRRMVRPPRRWAVTLQLYVCTRDMIPACKENSACGDHGVEISTISENEASG